MTATTKLSSSTETVLRGVHQTNQEDTFARARKLLAEAIGIDSHIDTIQRVMLGEDLSKPDDTGHVDIPRLREGGMHAPFFAFWVPIFFRGAEAVRRTLDLRDAMQSVLDANRDQIEMATTAADIERIVKAQKIAAFLTIEGGHAIDDDLRVLRNYYRLGIRAMTLTHAGNTNWADSANDTPAHNGRTRPQGRWEGVWWFSVEPGEIGLTALEGAGDGINQHIKDRLAQLTAGLA